jgi:hypothetical protein
MNDWSILTRLCDYLERTTKELDDKVHATQSEVMKLQDILDTISPVPVSEPKEEVKAARVQTNRKVFRGFDHKVAQQPVASSMNPFQDFVDLLQDYNALSKFDRSHNADRFTKRILDFSRTTAAHLHVRMVPCVQRLSSELDKVLDYDISQPALKFRAKYTTDKARQVVAEFDKLIQEFGLFRRAEVLSREQALEEPVKKVIVAVENPFETLANFTPKQLNTFYALRGNARRSLLSTTIKEKVESGFMSFLRAHATSDDETEEVHVLRAAQRAYMILSHDSKAYGLVVAK